MNRRPLIAAGTLIGIGMGGFVDGILFHQILQLHNMLSAKYPKTGVDAATALANVEINMFWDGLFHAGTWAMTALGIALLWRAAGRPDVPSRWSSRWSVPRARLRAPVRSSACARAARARAIRSCWVTASAALTAPPPPRPPCGGTTGTVPIVRTRVRLCQ